MAERKEDDGQGGVKLETRTRTQKPPLYKVLILNDDYTPMEFVVHVLERFFGLSTPRPSRSC
jgi:ATP-dependent Clp protease adaptor protein ClpS